MRAPGSNAARLRAVINGFAQNHLDGMYAHDTSGDLSRSYDEIDSGIVFGGGAHAFHGVAGEGGDGGMIDDDYNSLDDMLRSVSGLEDLRDARSSGGGGSVTHTRMRRISGNSAVSSVAARSVRTPTATTSQRSTPVRTRLTSRAQTAGACSAVPPSRVRSASSDKLRHVLSQQLPPTTQSVVSLVESLKVRFSTWCRRDVAMFRTVLSGLTPPPCAVAPGGVRIL